MEKRKEDSIEKISQDHELQKAAERSEDIALSEMAEREEGEHNQEEFIDDIPHDLRTSKTRRG